MARNLARLALISSILVCLGAYLYHVPNSEGVPQMDRIRLLSASMKVIWFVVSIELLPVDIVIRLLSVGLSI